MYLDKVLQPLLRMIPSICVSSASVIRDLVVHPLPLLETSTILTADVTSLYPSIPIDAGIIAVRRTCLEFNYMISKVDFIIDLLTWVLFNNYCIFNNQVYLQIKGTAMGTPVAVCFANLFLYQLEKPIIYLCPYYRRYIDDIFAVCNTHSDANEFVHRFNSSFVTITLDAVNIDTSGIFLDLHLFMYDNTLCHKLYQKPTNKYSYIPTISDHHPSIFHNFILQELKRYSLSCTFIFDYFALVSNFADRLSRRGYPPGYLTLALTKVPSRARLILALTRNPKPISNPHLKPIIIMGLPRLRPNPNWHQLFTIPIRLTDMLEYRLAYPSIPTHVILGRKQGKNIANILMSSTYPPP